MTRVSIAWHPRFRICVMKLSLPQWYLNGVQDRFEVLAGLHLHNSIGCMLSCVPIASYLVRFDAA